MRAHTNVRQGSPLILFSSKVSNDSTSTALIGQIAALTKSESGNQSPLSKEMKVSTHRTSDPELDITYSGSFVMMVSAIAIVFAVVFFVIGITNAYKGKATQTVTSAVLYVYLFCYCQESKLIGA